MRRLFLAFAVFSLGELQLEAAIFERDFLEAGDGLLTYDDVNQREWLDLPFTFGASIDQILGDMQPGGSLEGFSFANINDVAQLGISAQVEWGNYERYDPITVDPNLIPRNDPPSPGTPVGEKPKSIDVHAENLITSIGPVLRIDESYRDANFITRIQITSLSAFGLVFVGLDSTSPNFDGTNVSVLFSSTHIWTGDSFSIASSNGALATTPPEFFPQATDNTGPFWLFRNAVPEPSTFTLIYVAALAIATTRTSHR